ncbi:BH0509 family protein [Alkalicoccus halolimnae]|uniref:BH0509 family protein n=1 Tax=Alkalicoccus halolimnae TaxID=1667239 RepID=A0A5C7FDD1_9BACI|nr:BH0509 family protein [Alkalicoccus halolimnae]TXF87488.1 BH0509 family protein [Alkalicoccus halolimnae]
MKRMERENMIQFLTRVNGITSEKLMIMTDEDLDHTYTRTYNTYELYEELL